MQYFWAKCTFLFSRFCTLLDYHLHLEEFHQFGDAFEQNANQIANKVHI